LRFRSSDLFFKPNENGTTPVYTGDKEFCMKKLNGVIWVSLLLVAGIPSWARGQFGRNDNRSGDRVCVYQNSFFSGWEECYRPGDEVSDLHTDGNAISSIRFYGNAILTVYDRKNFEGGSAQINSEVKDLVQLSAGG